MNYEDKSKEDLIKELQELQQKYNSLKTFYEGKTITHKIKDIELSKAELFYQLLSENAIDVIWTYDHILNRFTYVSDSVESLRGYSPEEVMNQSIEEALTSESFIFINQLIAQGIAEKRPEDSKIIVTQYQIDQPCKDGSIVYTEVSSVTNFNSEGIPHETIGISRDISERIKREKELKNSEEKYRNLLENMHEVVMFVDNDDKILLVNKMFTEKLGYTPDEVIGKIGYEILLNPEDKKIIIEANKKRLNKEISQYEICFLSKNGHKIDFLINGAPVYDSEGSVIGSIGTMTDITERKKAEILLFEKNKEIEVQNEEYIQLNEELRQINEELFIAKEQAEENNRLKTAFLQNISQEIRTPMHAIISLSSLLKDDNNQDHANEIIQIIENSCQYLLKTVYDIIEIAQIESNQVVIKEQNTDIHLLMNELYEEFIAKLNGKATLRIVLKKDNQSPYEVLADSYRIKQVFRHLMDNAIKFTSNGIIEFGYIYFPEKLAFYVKDTGIGIPESKHKIIFERFHQESNSSNVHLFKGTGLGLSIAESIVKLMSGEIDVESEVGKGSTFTFTIPINYQSY